MLLNPRKHSKLFANTSSPRLGVWLCTVVSLGLGAVVSAHAANLEWPSAAPCNTTLQACINAAAAGDRVEIISASLIDENITISKSLSLVGTTGTNSFNGASIHYGQFVSGRVVTATSFPSTGTVTVLIDGLVFNDGGADAFYAGSGTLNATLRNLLIKNPGTSRSSGIRVQHSFSSTGTLNARIERNTLELGNGSLFAQGIDAESSSSTGTFSVEIYENKLQALRTIEGWGIYAGVTSGATATAKIWANEVRGEFWRGAIAAIEGYFSTTPSSLTAHIYSNVVVGEKGFGRGFSLVHSHGTINANIINNTATNQNNGISASRWSGGVGGGITGMHGNNLIAYNVERGIFLNPEYLTTINNQNNLLWANGSNQFTAHASTITANPQLIHLKFPWVFAGSPAIDAADTALGGLGAVFAGIPYLAADGLRRQKGSNLDIGAYEYGDVSFRHITTSANITNNYSTTNHPATNGNVNARLQATQQWQGVTSNNSYGVFLGSQWSLFNQVQANSMAVGIPFAIFSPDNALGSFVHVAKTTPTNNIAGWQTLIDNSATNDQPNDIVLVTQHWNAPGASTVYNPHPVGVFYLSLGSGKWFITNLDQTPGQDMPHNAGFNVYSQLPSKNVYRLTANSRNRLSSSTIYVDHPLLNGNPCAVPQVTRLISSTALTGNFDLYHAPDINRWIITQLGSPIADGQQFHVLIDPRQVQECAGVMFENGFE